MKHATLLCLLLAACGDEGSKTIKLATLGLEIDYPDLETRLNVLDDREVSIKSREYVTSTYVTIEKRPVDRAFVTQFLKGNTDISFKDLPDGFQVTYSRDGASKKWYEVDVYKTIGDKQIKCHYASSKSDRRDRMIKTCNSLRAVTSVSSK